MRKIFDAIFKKRNESIIMCLARVRCEGVDCETLRVLKLANGLAKYRAGGRQLELASAS